MKYAVLLLCLLGVYSCGIKGPPLPPLAEQPPPATQKKEETVETSISKEVTPNPKTTPSQKRKK